MVRKSLKFFAFLLFFIFALIAFMPKKSFYFLLEKELQNFEFVISNERLHEKLFSLEIENLELTTKGIDSAVVQSAEITLFGLYNCVILEDIQVSSLIDTYAPSKIESLELSYTLLNPLEIRASAQGDFGEAEISFTLLESELQAVVKPSKLMQTKYKKTMRMLKKDENGEYVYAKTF
jgi:hypothetical protein